MARIIPYKKKEIVEYVDFVTPVVQVKKDSAITGTYQVGEAWKGSPDFRLMDQYTLRNLYLYSRAIANAVDVVPQNALKQVANIIIDQDEDDELGTEIVEIGREFLAFAKKPLEDAFHGARLYGWAIIVMITEGTDESDYQNPLDLTKNGIIKDLRVVIGGVCRDAIVHKYNDDPLSGGYKTPLVYRIDPGIYVHHTRCILIQGIRDRRPVKNRGYFLAYSIVEPMAKAWMQYQNSLESILKILEDKSLDIITVANFRDILLKPGALQKTLNGMKTCREVLGAYIIDSTGKFEVMDRALSGINDAMEQFIMQLSMQGDLPKTVIFGVSPAGLTSGSYETDILDKLTALYCATDLDPALYQLLTTLFGLMGCPVAFKLDHQSAIEVTEMNQSEIDKNRSTAIKELSEAIDLMVNAGLMDRQIAAEVLRLSIDKINSIDMKTIKGDKGLATDQPPAKETTPKDPAVKNSSSPD